MGTVPVTVSLPDELWAIIFSYLEPIERYFLCMKVCHQWRAVAQQITFWRKIRVEKALSQHQAKAFLNIPIVRENLEMLELTKKHTIPDVAFPRLHTVKLEELCSLNVAAIMRLPLLKRVDIDKCVGSSEELDLLAGDIIAVKPSLRFYVRNLTLQFSDACKLDRIENYVSQFKDLCSVDSVSLQIYNISTPEKMRKLFQLYSVIRSFSHGWAELSQDLELLWVESIIPSSLTKISLENCSGKSVARKRLAFVTIPNLLPNLEDFKIGGLDEDEIKVVKPLDKLKSLYLMTATLSNMERKLIFSTWTRLTTLTVIGLQDVYYLVSTLSKYLPNLSCLAMFRAMYDRRECGRPLVTLPNLTNLTLCDSSFLQVPFLSVPACLKLNLARGFLPETSDYHNYYLVARTASLKTFSIPRLDQPGINALSQMQETLTCLTICREVRLGAGKDDTGLLRQVAKVCPLVSDLELPVRIIHSAGSWSSDESDSEGDDSDEAKERRYKRWAAKLAAAVQEFKRLLRLDLKIEDNSGGSHMKQVFFNELKTQLDYSSIDSHLGFSHAISKTVWFYPATVSEGLRRICAPSRPSPELTRSSAVLLSPNPSVLTSYSS